MSMSKTPDEIAEPPIPMSIEGNSMRFTKPVLLKSGDSMEIVTAYDKETGAVLKSEARVIRRRNA